VFASSRKKTKISPIGAATSAKGWDSVEDEGDKGEILSRERELDDALEELDCHHE
jgi:hypothetical protein